MQRADTTDKLAVELNKLLRTEHEFAQEAENDIQSLKIGHAKELYEEKKRLLAKEKYDQLEVEKTTQNQIIKLQAAAFDEWQKTHADATKKQKTEALKAIQNQYAFEGKQYEAMLKRNAEAKARSDARAKAKAQAEAVKAAADEIKLREKEELKGFERLNIKKRQQLREQVMNEQADMLVQEGHFKTKDEAKQALERSDAVERLNKTVSSLAGFVKTLNSDIETIGRSQSEIDTRLYGSNAHRKTLGSYWKAMEWDIGSKLGASPYLRQSDVVDTLKTMVGKGISFDVEQRAFLQTISDKIARTFDATDAALVKLVRIQQQDTTAARLGMEAALNAFLNNMYETTEYMTDAAADIRANLYEASALMSASSATEFEYQVQKWMGSLYSVGFGKSSELSSSLGKLAAGDISGITSGGTGNLLIMAANRAGISIADALQEGLDATTTNQLMESVVDYLAKIYKDSQGSKVIQQQFANVYGLTASDLKAAANLAGSTQNIARNGLDYGGMIYQLQTMANSIYQRVGLGEMLNNAFANAKYSLAGSIGTNPALYALWEVSNMLDEVANGIEFGIPTVMGNGMASQTFRVSDIMKVASASTAMIPALVKGVAALGNLNTNNLLRSFGVVSSPTTVSRGTGEGLLTTQMQTLSESNTYNMNEDSGDMTGKAMTDTQENAGEQTASAVDESNEIKLKDVNENVVAIYQLLSDVTTGVKALHVDIDGEVSWTGTIGGNSGSGTFVG